MLWPLRWSDKVSLAVHKTKDTKFPLLLLLLLLLLSCFLNIFITLLLVAGLYETTKDDFQNYSGILSQTDKVLWKYLCSRMWTCSLQTMTTGPWCSLMTTVLRKPCPKMTSSHCMISQDLFVSFQVRTANIVDFLLHLSPMIKLDACSLCKLVLRLPYYLAC